MEKSVEFYDRLFSEMINDQENLLEKVESLFKKWDDELTPIKEMMIKYGFLFQNPRLNGFSKFGAVIGIDKNGLLYTLQHGSAFLTDKNGDTMKGAIITLRNFLIQADLDVAKAGIDYVRNMRCIDSNPIAHRNNQLKDFLSENL
jgi:hypothetical protein